MTCATWERYEGALDVDQRILDNLINACRVVAESLDSLAPEE
jgi:hypothetical protein